MKISIKVKDGENICFNGVSSESVKELKARIQEKERILVHQYNIIFNGENLNDERLLSDYGIQDGSILLLVNKEKSLLLKHSIIFDNSDLVDRIHQSIIDLKICPHIDDVLDLLNEAISYLDEDLQPHVAIELFSLIISCSMQYSDQSLQLFNKRLQKGRLTSNHIISFAKILSNISMNFPQILIKKYDDFISNSFQQISQQILKSPDNNLIILENEIPPQFKNSFIADIILLINPTEQIVKNFSPYIINPKNDFDIINFFIKKVNESGLLNLISDSLLNKSRVYSFLTIENRELIIQSSTEQTFRIFLPIIESDLNNCRLTSSYCNTILNKLIEYDISVSSEFNIIFFEKIDDIELDSKNLEYLKRHKIKLPDKFLSKIETLPISLENIELFCNPIKMPPDHITNILYNANDLNIYKILLRSKNIMNDAFTKLDFWKHILTIVSSTKDEIDDYCISLFSFYIQLNRSAQNEKIFDGLIFDEHLPNERQSKFLLELFKNLYGKYFDRCPFLNKRERCQKLLTYNEIPARSLCKLFSCPNGFLTENTTTKEFYLFIFSFHKNATIPQCSYDIFGSNFFSINKIKSIFNKDDDLLLTQFIKNKNDFSLISQFDEKTFSLVVASLAFGNYSSSITINGLNKENALPFYAIAFNENHYNYDILTHSSKKMLNAFTASIIHSGNCNSSLLNESINSILSIGPDLLIKFNQSSFIFDILFDHLIHEKYRADKLLLFKFIFYISQLTIAFLVELYLDKIVQYGIRLFNIIFQNKTDIINSQLLDTSLLDLNVFDSNEIKSYIENEFHKCNSDDEIFQIILFYSKYCKNQPILNINDITADGIIRLYIQKIIDQKWDDFIQIIKFMSHNKMNIIYDLLKDKQIPFNVSHALMQYSSYYNDIDNYLNQCLNNPEFENEHSILIQLLLQNKSIVYKYIVASIEKLYPITYIDAYKEIFRSKPYLYNQIQEDDLLFVLKHLYSFNKNKFILVRKLNVKQPELPDIDYSIIDKLIQLKNFDCLHYIASCFPFLFENDIIKIIDSVLPTLNCLSFIFDEKFSRDDLMIAISALSFLYSCLQSTKFISTFIVWLFENIESLADSQIVCMSRILIALYQTDTINKIICGYALKYNLFDKLSNLLTKDVSNERFKPFYFDNLFQLFNIQCDNIYVQTNNKFDYSLINQISNGSLSNPFDIKFNFYSVIPIDFQKLSFSFRNQNTSTEFIDKYINRINESKIYWLSHKDSVISDQYNSNFLNNIKDEQYAFVYDMLPQIKPSSTKIISYLISQPKWAFDLLTGNDYFPVLPEHYSFLSEIKKNAPIDEDDEKSEKALENDVSVMKVIKSFLKDYLYLEIIYEDLYFQLILKKITNKNIFIELLMDILLEIETPPTFKLFYTNLSKLLFILITDDVDSNVNQKFFEKVGTKLISYFLSPYLIDEVLYTSKILTISNCNLPIQTIHIIEHLINNDPSNITLVFQLISKLEIEKVFPSITKIYIEKMKSYDIDYKIVGLFFKKFHNDKYNLTYKLKQLAKKNYSLYADCLSKCIHEYKKSVNQTLGDLIIIFFNILAPERKNCQVESSQASDEIDFTQSCQIEEDDDDDLNDYNDKFIRLGKATDQFYYNDVNFWQDIYEKHRKFLCFFSVINENNFEKLTFLRDYYELVPFEYRLSYFKKKASQLLRSKSYNRLVIQVYRSNILESTIYQLNSKNPKDLIGVIKVIFEDEIGFDEGGLTNEWFSLITKELLNPEYGLFISNENNCYHPNKLSEINSNHIDYFKLAGKIVALALLNNQNINAHFTKAFYRQILHQRIKLKDLENFDHSLFNSLKDILNVDDVKDLDLVFSIDDDVFGKITSIDLIENGENIQVTNDNRMNYVSLYANYKLRKSVIDQINAFCNAFDEIIPPELINIFSPSELDLLICGVPHIDLEDMINHTHYAMPYHDEHPTIVMLFNVLKKFSQEDLAKFLLFLTGSSQVPIGGFKIFEDNEKPIMIIYSNDIARLPVAHTCFRTLDLPCYDDESVLKNKLLKAINECDDFGLI